MIKLVDIFKSEDKTEYFGILDEDTSTIVYVTSFDLQKKFHDKPIEIEGVKYTNLNSIGFKIILQDKSKILHDKDKCYKTYDIKPCVDFYKLETYGLRNIPIGYRIIKDGIVYTYQKSSRMGLCWHAHLFAPIFDKAVIIELEKSLLGYPVTDLNHFFEESVPTKLASYSHFYDKIEDLEIDLSHIDFSEIQDISYFLAGMTHNVYLAEFNIDNVHYCTNAFVHNTSTESDIQMIDLSECMANPFLLDDTDVIKRSKPVQVFLINSTSWLKSKLDNIEAVDLGIYTDSQDIYTKVRQIQSKFAFMKKPFEKQVYYATRKEK